MKKLIILSTTFLLVGCCYNSNSIKKYNNLQVPSQEDSSSQEIEISTITKKYKNVIMFIGDGMGPNHVDAGGVYLGKPMCFDVINEKWTYHAYSNTDSLTSEGFTFDTTKSLLRPELNASLYDGTPSPYGGNIGSGGNITTYTDSAAGGTALATGKKTTNSRLGMDINGDPIENLVEIASSLGKKTGVVSSDELVGATPSSFLVHVTERHLEDNIIKGVAASPVDLVLTKKPASFTNNQAAYEALYKQNGFSLAYSVNQLDSSKDRQVGLFDSVTSRPYPNVPTLEDLTNIALDTLDNDEGFFLMVEGANIDKKSHSNDSRGMMNELMDFNNSVEAATLWAEGRDDTLIVVTADHETGGLYYDRETVTKESIVNDIKWLTQNHSRTRVDIAVYGDISEYVSLYGENFSTLEGIPYWDNTDVFRLCSTYLE